MGIDWDVNVNLTGLIDRAKAAIPAAAAAAMEHVKEVAVSRTPLEEGTLRNSAAVHEEKSGAAIHYDGPYAAYQHFKLNLRHETGRDHFLSSAVLDEVANARDIAAHRIGEAL